MSETVPNIDEIMGKRNWKKQIPKQNNSNEQKLELSDSEDENHQFIKNNMPM